MTRDGTAHGPSRPDGPPGADGMGGAEIAALHAGAAEVHLRGADLVLEDIEDPHGAPVETGAAVTAEALIDGNLDPDGRWGRNLQIPSHLSACRQAPPGPG